MANCEVRLAFREERADLGNRGLPGAYALSQLPRGPAEQGGVERAHNRGISCPYTLFVSPTVTVTKRPPWRAPRTLLRALDPVRLNRGTVCVWSDSVTLTPLPFLITIPSYLR